jgi:hypothetical protein
VCLLSHHDISQLLGLRHVLHGFEPFLSAFQKEDDGVQWIKLILVLHPAQSAAEKRAFSPQLPFSLYPRAISRFTSHTSRFCMSVPLLFSFCAVVS